MDGPEAHGAEAAERARLVFGVFTEVGILAQLSRTLLEARLGDGVGAPVFGLMSHLSKRREGRTPLDLARSFQVPKTTMSHTLALAVGRGWVETVPNPKDARSKIVRPTEAGLAWFGETVARLAPDIAERLADVPLETFEALLPRLAELRAVLDSRRDPER
ncbi:winged helix-turn-helix transcriptional regulator [Jannaschia sp. Os4]|uniref:MarR family winged helix-turn-helix transcriptional regulator n=1 Tax=Jannaschia sp. Os4 TaxID=2807617 RepID=UPI00193A19DB|nr:MarR family winged helix-turn-helix transcriptional regulator [Jannaschia sp. Os4]MBM2577592.1 winged helix-turn-helix transcriptional regulator [Jannaschia sp. Os4]